jgi:hypothetical protein
MARVLLIMAAGSGGHIFPGLAIAKEMQARGWDIHWMGTPAGMENKLVAQAGYPMVNVNMSGIRGKGALAWLVLPMRILVAFWQSTAAIFRIRPDVVLSMGGYVAFPGGMMAALWGKPLVVHEPGAVAGITNRVLAPVADRVIVGMEGAFERKVASRWANLLPKPGRVDWLGTPVRDEITALPPPDRRLAGRAGRLRLLVVGGSLGAQTMNDLVLAALAAMGPEERPEVVHQSGEKLYEGCARLREARRRGRGGALHRRHGGALRAGATCSSAARARSPWPRSPRRASPRSSFRCRGSSPTSSAPTRVPRRPRRRHRAAAARDATRDTRGAAARPHARALARHGAQGARARQARRHAPCADLCAELAHAA